MDFYLDFSLCKSVDGKDEDGNYRFQVEASNENVDFQDQIVLQSALLKSKENFLKNGVISYDHLHRRKDENGNVVSDPSMIIGEPTDVWTEGDKTFVKGILYKTNEMAQEVIKLLKAGSTRIRASVGGLFPKVTKDENGIENIVSVLWNDLALTPCPVNNTVGAASFAKSFSASEFAKALSVGHGTDSANFSGGRTLVAEDVEQRKHDIKDYSQDKDEDDEEEKIEKLAKSLIQNLEQGTIKTRQDAMMYLLNNGLEVYEANKSLEIINNMGGLSMIKRKSFSEVVEDMCKSLGKDENESKEVELFDLDDEEMEKSNDDDYDEDEEMAKSCKKSKSEDDEDDDFEDDEDDYVEAGDVLKSLQYELEATKKANKELEKSVQDIGDAVVNLAQMVAQNIEMTKSLGEEEIPFKAKINKSVTPNASKPSGKLGADEFKQAQLILCKSVQDGEISAVESSMIERDMQLAMQGKEMKKEYWNFISKKMGGN